MFCHGSVCFDIWASYILDVYGYYGFQLSFQRMIYCIVLASKRVTQHILIAVAIWHILPSRPANCTWHCRLIQHAKQSSAFWYHGSLHCMTNYVIHVVSTLHALTAHQLAYCVNHCLFWIFILAAIQPHTSVNMLSWQFSNQHATCRSSHRC